MIQNQFRGKNWQEPLKVCLLNVDDLKVSWSNRQK
jgi:hypothetical protein